MSVVRFRHKAYIELIITTNQCLDEHHPHDLHFDILKIIPVSLLFQLLSWEEQFYEKTDIIIKNQITNKQHQCEVKS